LLGCVVFGRVAGDSAAAYLLQNAQSTSEKASSRLGAVAGHLQPLETKVIVDPTGERVNIEFSWKGQNASASTSSSSSAPAKAAPKEEKKKETKSAAGDASGHNPEATGASPPKAKAEEKGEAKAGGAKSGEYTAEEVAKHNTKDDCWVIVDGKVLDVTKFLPDHPGGEKAILLYAGRDATEEFNMLHDPKVIPRYAPEATIGIVKK